MKYTWGMLDSRQTKTDENEKLAGTQWEHQECSILCFTETWLQGDIPDTEVYLSDCEINWQTRLLFKNIEIHALHKRPTFFPHYLTLNETNPSLS